MMFLPELAKHVKLTEEEVKFYTKHMSSYPWFVRWIAEEGHESGLEDIAKMYKYETSRKVVRAIVLDRLVMKYNREFGRQNREAVKRVVAK